MGLTDSSHSGPGLPVMAMLVVAIVSALCLFLPRYSAIDTQETIDASHSARPLHVWVSVESHAMVLRTIARDLSARWGRPIEIDLIDNRALNTRLTGLFMSAENGEALPDLVEIESGSVGRYFRVPASHVPFAPLDQRLAQSPSTNVSSTKPISKNTWADHLIPSRLTCWQREGTTFGIPLDVHPVMITYRHDLFLAAGIDLSLVKTWAEFAQAGQRYIQYWSAHGHPERRAIALSSRSADGLLMMLLQRRINLVGDDRSVYLTDPRVLDTLMTYLPMVAGPTAIAGEPSISPGGWAEDLADGRIGAMLTPDWRLDELPPATSDTAGNLRLLPLPVFDESDAPTSTWGGSMVAIPRDAADVQLSWQLMQALYLNADANASRMANSHILPAVIPWDDQLLARHDPYFGNQPVGQLFANLAPMTPARTLTPFTAMAELQLARVLSASVDMAGHSDIASLKPALADRLNSAQEDVLRRIAHGRMEGP